MRRPRHSNRPPVRILPFKPTRPVPPSQYGMPAPTSAELAEAMDWLELLHPVAFAIVHRMLRQLVAKYSHEEGR